MSARGFVFVTPEYNHSTSGVLKNAIDFLYAEWNNKAMGVVSYGTAGGTRAAEHLRLIAGELKMADVRANVALSAFTDFENWTVLKPGPHQVRALGALLDEVIAWSQASRHFGRLSRPRSTMRHSSSGLGEVCEGHGVSPNGGLLSRRQRSRAVTG